MSNHGEAEAAKEEAPKMDNMRMKMSNFRAHKKREDPTIYIIAESFLIISGIPTILFFFVGVINGLILLTEQPYYDVCIASKVVTKIAAGGSSSDVPNMLKAHIIGSTTCLWALIIVYFQILFMLIKPLYRVSGILYFLVLLGSMIFHSVAAKWLDDNQCTDTKIYGLAMFNTIFFFILFGVIMTGASVLFIRGLAINCCKKKPGTGQKKKEEDERLAVSEERMLNDKAHGNGEEEMEENTEDEKNKTKRTLQHRASEEGGRRKNNDPEDEDEDGDERAGKRRGNDPEDEDEEQIEDGGERNDENIEDELEEELNQIC